MLRRFKLGGVIFLSTLLSLVSCQSEKLVNDGGSQQGQQFTLTASKGIMSRTHLGSDGKQTVWSEGDKIFVSSLDGTVTGTLELDKADIGKPSGKFSGFVFGSVEKLNGGYSVFPKPEKKNGKYILDLSVLSGGNELDAPFIGPITGNNVKFEHTCGVLNITNLSNAEGRELTISAKNNGTDYNLKTIATVVVDANGARLEYSAPSTGGTITLSNIKTAENKTIYVPYSIDKDVTFYVDGIEEGSVTAQEFFGKIKQTTNETILSYSQSTGNFVVPVTFTSTTGNTQVSTETKTDEDGTSIEVSTLTFDLSGSNNNTGDDGNTGGDNNTGGESGENTNPQIYENVTIPSLTTAITDNIIGDNEKPVNVVIELPKVEETKAASTITFEEVPSNITVTIQEEKKNSNTKSIENLTVVLPAGTTEAEVKEAVVIDMPNTTVTIKSATGDILFINEMTAETADRTLVIEKDVEITSLTIKKGSVQVFGRIDKIKRDSNNPDSETTVIIEKGGHVGTVEGPGIKVNNKNNVGGTNSNTSGNNFGNGGVF